MPVSVPVLVPVTHAARAVGVLIPALTLLVLCLGGCPTREGRKATDKPEPSKANTAYTGSDDPRLQALYTCWQQSPYEHMFAPVFNPDEEMGMFMGGINGIMGYGSLSGCMAKQTGLSRGSVYDRRGVEAFAKLKMLARPRAKGDPFKHFNPAIIRWGHQTLIPKPSDRIGYRTAQEHYEETFVRFFRLMTDSYLMLERGKRWDIEWKAYSDEVIKGGADGLDWLEGRYSSSLQDYPEGQDGTTFTASMAFGFWLRRRADGTAAELWVGLQKLMRLYDAEWFAHRLN